MHQPSWSKDSDVLLQKTETSRSQDEPEQGYFAIALLEKVCNALHEILNSLHLRGIDSGVVVVAAVTMARTSEAPPAAVRGGPHLTVSWRRPGSKRWQPFEDKVGRAILAAGASGEATFQLEETVRRSPRFSSEQWKKKRARASRRSLKEAKQDDLVVTLKNIGDGSPASNSGPAIRWGFSSTCTFDRLPNTARALAAMIAECEAATKRQIISELLNFLTSEERINEFLSKIDIGCQPVHYYSPGLVAKCGTLRVSRVAVNERARPGGALYERFLTTMVGHVADLGGALQSLMGSATQSIAPLTFAFHGTPPPNVPSILESGMLPEKRVAAGDWFGTLPFVSVNYCQKEYGKGIFGGPPFRVILFLILSIRKALLYDYNSDAGVIVVSNPHYELPVCTVDLEKN
ncbi:hypothetical protein KFL_001310210 [Klebsormidium nitens]|uniref:Uncharacterized protein n=1 Tax=Klebsormidium nitens TaxID=105231 RepID=A0A1Y1I1D6_KLENI|nr:hypothetical protein KFL_001310210 [Klebsormidium nitens]|eukprot:GAQ82991.1 hypothetical protein KFL_001310210 [Klebsormidium nitens]